MNEPRSGRTTRMLLRVIEEQQPLVAVVGATAQHAHELLAHLARLMDEKGVKYQQINQRTIQTHNQTIRAVPIHQYLDRTNRITGKWEEYVDYVDHYASDVYSRWAYKEELRRAQQEQEEKEKASFFLIPETPSDLPSPWGEG